ncbi:putative C6 transcription factor [Jackrogersella minutella]|nr:putative C6 transcription factor [Jackrogersella minutella]
MPQSSVEGHQLGSEDGLKNYSCLICRQRKVKCDRHTPCSNCVKAEKQCSFIPPVRGKRKRTRPRREGLHARLKRYEDLLKSFGANVEPSEELDDSDSETASRPDVEMDRNGEPQNKSQRDPFGLEESKPKLITKEGTSSYFESAPWSNLGDESQHPEVGGVGEPIEESTIHENNMFFEPENGYGLEGLHPSFQVLPKLREIYADRIHPLMNVLHLPTFWTSLMNGLRSPQEMPKSLEAAAFAFYLATIHSLGEDECGTFFGAQKSVTQSRYRAAARQTLVKAGFLSTTSIMTLRAYAIFLMCVRSSYQCDTLFVMTGVAVRLGRKMGLHRDGTSLGLPPFETEMRRRLWWQLAHMDFRTADVMGMRPSLDVLCGDTQAPLNVEDEDLLPDMIDPPPERNGITAITSCIVKCNIIDTMRKFPSSYPGDVRWEVLSNPDVPFSKKETLINQTEDQWERLYVRYCDPSNSLHNCVVITIRASICRMKIFAHNPRQFANSPKVPQRERDVVFANATKLLDYVIMVQRRSHGLDKYGWMFGGSFLWNTILYVLIEVRHRRIGPEVDRAWELIGTLFSHYPQIFETCAGAVSATLRKWTMTVWDEYVAASKSEGLPEPTAPDYIIAIRRCRIAVLESPSKAKDPPEDPGLTTRNPLSHDENQHQKCDGNPDPESFELYDAPDLLSFDMDPSEWVQWEQIIAEQSGLNHVGHM